MSSSSSSPQASGVAGRMAEMSGNGSGCWGSKAAIGELRRGRSCARVVGGDGGGHQQNFARDLIGASGTFLYAT